MVSVPELKNAKPKLWRDAADDVLRAAKHCEEIGGLARDHVAPTLQQCWIGDTGEKARRVFVDHANEYEAASLSLRALTKAYDHLAEVVEGSQRDLLSALEWASSHDLHVDESGRVQLAKQVVTAPGDTTYTDRIRHVEGIVRDALDKATKADAVAAAAMRTVKGLAEIRDPALVKEGLTENSPLNIALRLAGRVKKDGLHPVNVSPAQIAAMERAAKETGMSRTLLLAILWQEQQAYQNQEKTDGGPRTAYGRLRDFMLEETIKPDKSLGIAHMKLKTARAVIAAHTDRFTAEGRSLNELSDRQLTKYIEENPNEDIRLSAYYLKDLKKNPYGARSDKHLFMLYAADTQQVREYNERYGDATEGRDGAIGRRAANWDQLKPHLEDAQRWDGLSDAQRERAIKQLESQAPKGRYIDLSPLYDTGGPSSGTGTGKPKFHVPPPPAVPSPSPGPAPTPPK
ncbi:hypothetical protein [Streptomyces huiliensis]|uniref:hypothetical protein n=1 Tax=Streptomyces huiliensis TaxID=2876027 RepID=UPI001CBFEC55|nr:hypothetical protein [Streptomyces huiliensis]MBZ4318116.1 hypothetical protein [Streptomyces huiliensis]